MKIGYSFWGFLGSGIIDTPDGGRSHRRTLIDGLIALGHDIVFLQPNRDLEEAGEDLRHTYAWSAGLPAVDALFLEWRWPIPGRNTTACGTPGHTCDLHRQDVLLSHYTYAQTTPTILWDKDRRLPARDMLRTLPHVVVCEPALHPSPGAVSLLFPVADATLEEADPAALASEPRDLNLVYVGNQYDRDEPFDRFFAPAAAGARHLVAGKWTDTQRWPEVTFTGRVAFTEVQRLHRRALATVLLLPDRYAAVGQFTQRIFEAVLAGCLPLAPATIRSVDRVVPGELHVHDSGELTETLAALRRLAGTPEHVELIARCLRHLDVFRLSRQLATITAALHP